MEIKISSQFKEEKKVALVYLSRCRRRAQELRGAIFQCAILLTPSLCLVLLDFNQASLVKCSELRLRCNTRRELADKVSEEASTLNRNPREG